MGDFGVMLGGILMDKMLEFIQNPSFLFVVLIFVWILIVLVIINLVSLMKLKNNYKKLMEVLGKGNNFNDMLNAYISEVDRTAKEITVLKNKTDNISKNVEKCFQKVGIVRYNAFSETGGSLSFALALLDFENTGFIINGVYSRDNTTTTYAKPVINGKSKYTLVKEEEEALEMALHSGYSCFLNF